MEKIESFKVNHLNLEPGLYVSRIDEKDGCMVTSFDMRITSPNREPVMDMPAIHTIEHLGATFLRNSERKEEVLYFGPMGCRTGFYILMFGALSSADILSLVVEMCNFIIEFQGEIPGAKPDECGNWSEQNLPMAKYYIKKYKNDLLSLKNLKYKD